MSSKNLLQEEFPAIRDLRVSSEFVGCDETTESETIARLEVWNGTAYKVLTSLREHLRTRGTLGVQQQAELVFATTQFLGDDPWVPESFAEIVQDILSLSVSPTPELLERVLRDFVKPIFQPNPHPQINVETGRKLPRPAGGPLGHLDFLEGQEWKAYPGIANVLSWCITHADARGVERLWHLYIPPIMTLLDDHQAHYKLRGVRLASQLLQVAPSNLLRRTGIDTLLLNSFKTCLAFLHDPQTPDLVRATVSTSVRLTELTTADRPGPRFDQLCALLGDSIIGNVWVYASSEPDTLRASVDAIPEILRVLDFGATRYLKALIPQLTFPLIPAPENGASLAFKRSSLRALCVVMQACAPRIHKWRGSILNAILRCWVDIMEGGGESNECAELKDQLRSACALLIAVCEPVASELEMEYGRILALDANLLSPLLLPTETC